MSHHTIWRLRNQHRWLTRRLDTELRRPQPDAFVVQDLKRKKLQTKDELFLAEANLSALCLEPSHA